MSFPLESLTTRDVAEIVEHFVTGVEPQVVPAFERFDQKVSGITADVPELSMKVTMTRTEWLVRGKFRASRLGRLILGGDAGPDYLLRIEDLRDPSKSRSITARDAQYESVHVRQGEPKPPKSRRPIKDDITFLNTTLLNIAHLHTGLGRDINEN